MNISVNVLMSDVVKVVNLSGRVKSNKHGYQAAELSFDFHIETMGMSKGLIPWLNFYVFILSYLGPVIVLSLSFLTHKPNPDLSITNWKSWRLWNFWVLSFLLWCSRMESGWKHFYCFQLLLLQLDMRSFSLCWCFLHS